MALRIVDEMVGSVGRVFGIAGVVARHDADLAKQMRRSAASVGLNACEGLHGKGGNRTVRLESAMCSGRETIMAIRIAGAAGYVDAETVAKETDDLDRIVATLHKLTYPRR